MIQREQVINRLREANYSFSRQADRVEIWRQRGTGQRVNVARRDLLDEKYVQIVLKQAGLSDHEIRAFLAACIKAG